MNSILRNYIRQIADAIFTLFGPSARTMGPLVLFLSLSFSGFAQGVKDSDSLKSQSGANPQPQTVEELRYSLGQAIEKNDLRSQAEYRLKLVDMNLNLMLYDQVIEELLKALHIYQDLNDSTGMAECRLLLQGNYREAKDYLSSLDNAFLGLQIASRSKIKGNIIFPRQDIEPLLLAEISQTYLQMNQVDSALIYTRESIERNVQMNHSTWNFPIYLMGTIQTLKGNYDAAMESFRKAWPLAVPNEFPHDTIQIASGISTLYKKMGEWDSSAYYAMIVVKESLSVNEAKTLLEALANLVEIYKKEGKKDSALKYLEMSSNFKDSLYSDEKLRSVRELTSKEADRQREIAATRQQYRNNVRTVILIAVLVGLIIVAALLWRNNLNRKKSYSLMEKQKKETDIQKTKVEATLEELRATQKQLVQSEKMASLGELTAGIAHEIQNPLNFVNNFAEINTELFKELEQAIENGNKEEAGKLMEDINLNLSKIAHHGRRADSIVKGMLQHSRTDKGQKEATDINKLADEYLRLAYHGMRTRDPRDSVSKSFNATLKTDFDETIGTVPVVSQDFGRVLLNLFNNAFYEVMHKHYLNGEQPTVSVSTRKKIGEAEIRIRDNGMGIPEKIIDKIFQPFFTTKPTGQGTGLGLSLSYDIIVKEHGGNITINTLKGKFCEFIITLPLI